jgi:uncharacterized membrane protein
MKTKNNKVKKAFLLAAMAGIALTAGDSIFNRAQATGGGTGTNRYQAVGEDGVNICYCNKAGSKCLCVS